MVKRALFWNKIFVCLKKTLGIIKHHSKFQCTRSNRSQNKNNCQANKFFLNQHFWTHVKLYMGFCTFSICYSLERYSYYFHLVQWPVPWRFQCSINNVFVLLVKLQGGFTVTTKFVTVNEDFEFDFFVCHNHVTTIIVINYSGRHDMLTFIELLIIVTVWLFSVNN